MCEFVNVVASTAAGSARPCRAMFSSADATVGLKRRGGATTRVLLLVVVARLCRQHQLSQHQQQRTKQRARRATTHLVPIEIDRDRSSNVGRAVCWCC